MSKRGELTFARSEDDLLVCSLKGWENGFYNRLKIIDSDGKLFTVDRAERVGYSGPFWGLSLLYGQRIRVRLVLEGVERTLTSDEAKGIVLKWMLRDGSHYSSGYTKEELQAVIRSEDKIGDLIQALAVDFYRKY